MTRNGPLFFASGAAIPLLAALACPLAGAAQAGAGGDRSAATVVWLDDGPRSPELADALRVEIAAARAPVVLGPAPAGDTPLLRAAAAQATTRSLGARYGVFVEREPTPGAGDLVRAVDAESEHVRSAPLPSPATTIDARTLAAVAASLLDELDAPPPAGGPVTVHLEVETPTGSLVVDASSNETGEGLVAPESELAMTPEPPPLAVPVVDMRAARESSQSELALAGAREGNPRTGWVLGTGLVLAGVAYGGELALGAYLTEHLRVMATAQAMAVFFVQSDVFPSTTFGLDVTRVGSGRNGRFDFGGFAQLLVVFPPRYEAVSVLPAGPDTWSGGGPSYSAVVGGTLGAHLGLMWELGARTAIGFRVGAGASLVDGGDVVPFGHLTLRLELPL